MTALETLAAEDIRKDAEFKAAVRAMLDKNAVKELVPADFAEALFREVCFWSRLDDHRMVSKRLLRDFVDLKMPFPIGHLATDQVTACLRQLVVSRVGEMKADRKAAEWLSLPQIPLPDSQLTAGELKAMLKDIPDDTEMFIRAQTPCGNISGVYRVNRSTYGFFGIEIPCIIFEPDAEDEDKDDDFMEWDDDEEKGDDVDPLTGRTLEALRFMPWHLRNLMEMTSHETIALKALMATKDLSMLAETRKLLWELMDRYSVPEFESVDRYLIAAENAFREGKEERSYVNALSLLTIATDVLSCHLKQAKQERDALDAKKGEKEE